MMRIGDVAATRAPGRADGDARGTHRSWQQPQRAAFAGSVMRAVLWHRAAVG